jgi:hypothetical protein
MPKTAHARRRATASSPATAAAERPRRSTRAKPTRDDTEKIRSRNNTKTKSKVSSRGKPKGQSQPIYTRSSSEADRDLNRRLPLFALPTELLKLIVSEHLALESALSLSLTCKEALSSIGTWPWAAFKKETRWSIARTNFFRGLTRDWQAKEEAKTDLEFCKRCNTLHPLLPRPNRHKKTTLTTYCLGQNACIDYLPRKVGGDGGDDEQRGWSLLFPHIVEAMKASSSHAQKGQYGAPISLLSGDFSTIFPNMSVGLRLSSSARRVDGNLVVRHEFTFQTLKQKRVRLCAKDILSLPLYICPHQCTTTTGPREESHFIKNEGRNSPLFAYAVVSAFPQQQQSSFVPSLFRNPTPHERKAMDAADQAGQQHSPVWSCRSCSTKYRVELLQNSDLRILSWHCFGRDLQHASRYWRFFVRREGKMMSRTKRNDEWWSPTGVVDFEVGE